ncbi:hypothetical protein C8J40_105198 [Sphingomonas sp. PP-CC-3A-396]|nr:hypothetical protein C8J40_105198 [Sphingomonas sp. PP-CC-3A-396]
MLAIAALLAAEPFVKTGQDRLASDSKINNTRSGRLGFGNQAQCTSAEIHDEQRPLQQGPGGLIGEVEESRGYRPQSADPNASTVDDRLDNRQGKQIRQRKTWRVTAAPVQRCKRITPPAKRVLRELKRLTHLAGCQFQVQSTTRLVWG